MCPQQPAAHDTHGSMIRVALETCCLLAGTAVLLSPRAQEQRRDAAPTVQVVPSSQAAPYRQAALRVVAQLRELGHSVVLLESFVERERFAGTCYRAANWQWVGVTTGRSRQDRTHTVQVPVKDVWVCPLRPEVREVLCR